MNLQKSEFLAEASMAARLHNMRWHIADRHTARRHCFHSSYTYTHLDISIHAPSYQHTRNSISAYMYLDISIHALSYQHALCFIHAP